MDQKIYDKHILYEIDLNTDLWEEDKQRHLWSEDVVIISISCWGKESGRICSFEPWFSDVYDILKLNIFSDDKGEDGRGEVDLHRPVLADLSALLPLPVSRRSLQDWAVLPALTSYQWPNWHTSHPSTNTRGL